MYYKKNQIILMVVLLCITVFSSFSQDNYFKIGAQYRLRPEFRNGYKTLATDSSKSAFFLAQRARMIFDYKNDNVQFYASIQDARTWGDEEQIKDLAGLQVNELWAEINLKKGFALKMGRQELVYDDHRLLGNLDWANSTISHDALLLKYNKDASKFKWHLGGAFNQFGEPIFGTNYSLSNYKALGFTWLKKEFNKGHSLSGLVILNGVNSTTAATKKMRTSYTFGPLYNYNLDGWKAVLGAYYQGGKTESNLTIGAFMVNAYLDKKIDKFLVGLGADYLSGNTDKTNATLTSNNFSTLYATNHKFYGYMDYFLNIPNDTKKRGLADLYARFGYTFSKTVTTTLDVHHFLLANPYYKTVVKVDRPLGTEADLLLDYKPSQIINVQFGYSILFANKNMEYLKGGNANATNTWAYIMLKVSPTLLFNEFKK